MSESLTGRAVSGYSGQEVALQKQKGPGGGLRGTL
jgi:hypothetical protein